MPFTFTCQCGESYSLPDNSAGKSFRCRECGAKSKIVRPEIDASGPLLLEAALDDDDGPLAKILPSKAVIPQPLPEPPKPKQYKVLTQKDKWFSGKFDPEKVEGAINAYAQQGWVLKAVATASIPGFTGTRDEVMIFMER
jgi:hypothetical protein